MAVTSLTIERIHLVRLPERQDHNSHVLAGIVGVLTVLDEVHLLELQTLLHSSHEPPAKGDVRRREHQLGIGLGVPLFSQLSVDILHEVGEGREQ